MAIVRAKSASDLAMAILAASLTLVIALAVFVYRSKKTRRQYVRWTRKPAKIILLLVIIAAVVATLALAGANQEAPTKKSVTSDGTFGSQGYVEGLTFTQEKLLELSNMERTQNSKIPLTINAKLSESALKKCQDMVSKNYWSHNDNQGVPPWHFINEAGYLYGTAGENLAYGFRSENAVITGWMNSSAHKENLLGDFKEVGFGICKSENFIQKGPQLLIVQHLASPTVAPSYNQPVKPNTYTAKPYAASVCSRTVIPYETVYIDASYMYVGETQSYGGWNGYKETCTADSAGHKPADYISEPYSKTVYRGTKVRAPSTTYTPPMTGVSPSLPCAPDGQGGWQC